MKLNLVVFLILLHLSDLGHVQAWIFKGKWIPIHNSKRIYASLGGLKPKQMPETILIIDGTAMMIKAMKATSSEPYLQRRGFQFQFDMVDRVHERIFHLAEKCQSNYLVLAFDSGEKYFRREMYPKYKINRNPQSLFQKVQLQLWADYFERVGITCLTRAGYEGDDVMATIGVQARKRSLKVIYCSDDKDLRQMIDDEYSFILPLSGGMLLSKWEISQKYKVFPSQLCDYFALVGDSSDNIPGVAGIGKETASYLIRHFGSIDNLYQQLGLASNNITVSVSEQSALVHLDDMLRSYSSVTNLKSANILKSLRNSSYTDVCLYKGLLALKKEGPLFFVSPHNNRYLLNSDIVVVDDYHDSSFDVSKNCAEDFSRVIFTDFDLLR